MMHMTSIRRDVLARIKRKGLPNKLGDFLTPRGKNIMPTLIAAGWARYVANEGFALTDEGEAALIEGSD